MEYVGIILLFLIGVLFNLSEETYIHNGGNARQGQFPFMVSIQIVYPIRKHYCGGSIIDARWVITAAHCMEPTFEIEAGNVELYSGLYYKVGRIITHPNFVWGYKTNDIALMQITKKSFNFSNPNIGIIKLYNRPFAFIGDNITAIGWGENEYDSLPTHLQYTSELNIAICNKKVTGLDHALVCINHDPHITTCKGDSGGPAVYNEFPEIYNDIGKLIGIVSGGGLPCNNGNQNRFTRIHYYKDWVLKHVPNKNMFV